jgi:hypothetical protein
MRYIQPHITNILNAVSAVRGPKASDMFEGDLDRTQNPAYEADE